MKLTSLLALGLAVVVTVTGCGGGGGGGNGGSDVAVFGVTTGNRLVKFELDSPGEIDLDVAITGLSGGETIVGIDFRESNGALYGIGSTSRLYTINTVTGVATPVAGVFATLLLGTSFGVDFNDAVDRIRVVSNDEQNMRVNPDTGAVAAVDTALSPVGNVVAAAYTATSFGGTTTLYAIDSGTNTLVRIGSVNGTPQSPNTGIVNTIGSLGFDISGNVGFDMSSDGAAIISDQPALGTTNLYAVDINNGSTSFIGIVGNNLSLTSIALKD